MLAEALLRIRACEDPIVTEFAEPTTKDASPPMTSKSHVLAVPLDKSIASPPPIVILPVVELPTVTFVRLLEIPESVASSRL